MHGIAAIGVDGKVDTDFNIPAVVSAVSDIITLNDSPEGGRTKNNSGLLYTVGSFSLNNSSAPSFVLKMQVDTGSGAMPDITTGLETPASKVNSFSVEIFPQPVKDKLSIKIHDLSGNVHAQVFDLTGKKYVETNVALRGGDNPPEINVQNAPPGFYLLKLRTEYGREAFVKFVKVK